MIIDIGRKRASGLAPLSETAEMNLLRSLAISRMLGSSISNFSPVTICQIALTIEMFIVPIRLIG